MTLAASAPLSYHHNDGGVGNPVGGGAWDDGTTGVDKDIVKSLLGGDFVCGDTVTFLTQVVVADTASAGTDAPQTIELNYAFTADSTGQSGAALSEVTFVAVNYGTIVDLIPGENTVDDGFSATEDGGSTATLVGQHLTGPLFGNVPGTNDASELLATVELDDLDRGETSDRPN